MKSIIALWVFVIILGIFVFQCNAGLCSDKGGHLAISLLNHGGYACVNDKGEVIAIP